MVFHFFTTLKALSFNSRQYQEYVICPFFFLVFVPPVFWIFNKDQHVSPYGFLSWNFKTNQKKFFLLVCENQNSFFLTDNF